MDAISQIVRLARVEAVFDKRCLLAPSTAMDVAYGQREAPFHVLLDGECRLQAGAHTLHLRAGDVVIIPRGAVHRVITPGPGPLHGTVDRTGSSFTTTRTAPGSGADAIDLFCGHFSYGLGAGDLLFRSLPDPIHVSFGECPETDEMIRGLTALMRLEAADEGPGTAAIISSLCTVLLAMVLRSRGAASKPALWTATGDDRIAALMQQVVADPGADWSIERLSRSAAMSRATLLRHLRRDAGSTAAGFVSRIRMMAASEKLRTTDDSVATVAATVGYHSESAFSRAFRDAMGTTPARFRRAARELA